MILHVLVIVKCIVLSIFESRICWLAERSLTVGFTGLVVLKEGLKVNRAYSPEELAEILNIDPELIDFYLERSLAPIEKDISYCIYDRNYYEEAMAEFKKKDAN